MASLRVSALALCFALAACLAPCAHANYKGYGSTYTSPQNETIRTYITFFTDGRIGAMGAEFSPGFLNASHLANLTYQSYPLVGAPSFTSLGQRPFQYTGIREILLPWPRSNVVSNPYAYMRLLYNPSGHPSGGLVPSQLGMWNYSQWLMSYEYINRNQSDAYWASDPYPRGPCFGMSPAHFYDVFRPVAKRCFVKAPYRNVGDAQYGHTVHLVDLTAPEWNPIRPFNTSVLWGTFNGSVSSLQFQVRSELFNNAPPQPAQCIPVTGTPTRAPEARLSPTQACWFKLPSGATVFQVNEFRTIPKGDCRVRSSNPAAASSFFPPAFAQVANETLNVTQCLFPRAGREFPSIR